MTPRLLPDSSLLTRAERAALGYANSSIKELLAAVDGSQSLAWVPVAEAVAIRKRQAESFYRTSCYGKLRERYAVTLAPSEVGGVQGEVFSPACGVAPKNERRLLINLHGGGFQGGWGITSQFESVPIAAIGGIKVLSVNYRMAPEHRFPAATDDVLVVYQALLKDYAPKCIGIYGCSAGALLTTQTAARLLSEGLPLPGAIGMLCGAGTYWFEGDSGQINPLINDTSFLAAKEDPYFKDTGPDNQLAFPARCPSLLAKFPPSLLISATRDHALSSVVHTHSLLTQQGVKAELHVWEGLNHAFHYLPDLPQSREAHEVTWRFFDSVLN